MTLTMSRPSIRTTQEQVDDVILDLLPSQGDWDEETYLWLTDQTNRLIEYTDGYIEVLPMPTDAHQSVLKRLVLIFVAFIETSGGIVNFAPLRVRIRERKYREPDLLVMRDAHDVRRQNRYWLGADLVLEVVSDDDSDRDYEVKRREYAEAGIPEYWIVDPQKRVITVLRLADGAYVEHGVFVEGQPATSATLDGFSVDVTAVFAAN